MLIVWSESENENKVSANSYGEFSKYKKDRRLEGPRTFGPVRVSALLEHEIRNLPKCPEDKWYPGFSAWKHSFLSILEALDLKKYIEKGYSAKNEKALESQVEEGKKMLLKFIFKEKLPCFINKFTINVQFEPASIWDEVLSTFDYHTTFSEIVDQTQELLKLKSKTYKGIIRWIKDVELAFHVGQEKTFIEDFKTLCLMINEQNKWDWPFTKTNIMHAEDTPHLRKIILQDLYRYSHPEFFEPPHVDANRVGKSKVNNKNSKFIRKKNQLQNSPKNHKDPSSSDSNEPCDICREVGHIEEECPSIEYCQACIFRQKQKQKLIDIELDS